MKNKPILINLDGEETGFCVSITSIYPDDNRPHVRWLRSKKGGIRLFTNLKIAEATTRTIINSNYPSILEYHVYINPDIIIPLKDCQYIDNHYETFFGEDLYIIKYKSDRKILRAGYFTDRSSAKNCKEVYRIAKEICFDMLFEGKYGVSKIERRKDEFVVILQNTAEIHIMSIKGLININQSRKDNNLCPIPYIREVPVNSSIYYYASKDTYASSRMHSADYIFNFADEFIARFKEVENMEYIAIKVEKNFVVVEKDNKLW